MHGALINALICLQYPLLAARFMRLAGRLPSPAFPVVYSDKMQWRKIFDHNPLFITFSDKLAAKDHLARHCPDLALPRTLWQGHSIDEAPPEVLAGDVVVKANHGSTMNHFIRGGRYDPAELRRLTQGWMARRYGGSNAEWAYAHVRPMLLVEELLVGESGPLVEINIRAGGGRVMLGSLLLHAKTKRQSAIYLDAEGRRIDTLVGEGMDRAELDRVPVPEGYAQAWRHAERMSREVDYARYDFFWTGSRLYGGEITVYPASGYSILNEIDRLIGNGWDLRTAWFMTAPLSGWRARYREALRRHLDRLESALPG